MAAHKPRLVLATTNVGKVDELAALLSGRYLVEPRPLDLVDTVEDGNTLEANAIKKAVEVATSTHQTTLADDSGLFVDALAGAPGLFTARYAGPDCKPDDNIEKLLSKLQGKLGDERRAIFRTVIAVVEGEDVLVAEGSVVGRIAEERTGQNGFGYDPIFVPDESNGLTFAEMMPKDKHKISHRSRALNKMLTLLAR